MAEMIRLRKQLKKPVANVLQLMDIGFSDEEFCNKFAYCYEYLWTDIIKTYMSYRDMDKRRRKIGLKLKYKFPNPKPYLCFVAFHGMKRVRKQHQARQVMPDMERAQLEALYRSKSDKKMAGRKAKREYNMRYVQTVTPYYTNYLEKEYFRIKHNKPSDVTQRYIMLLEAARYKCEKTKALLYKVNASERNYNLRFFAFQTLQRWGEEVKLGKNRKGKKHLGDTEHFSKIDTPAELLNLIYNLQMEQNKVYDVFVSHSYKDNERILDMKMMLNTDGLNVYIDWVCDRNALHRSMTNKDTAKVLAERLNNSSVLLYVYTNGSAHSQWSPWELGLFHASGKPIFVLVDTENKEDMPAYLDLYPRAVIQDGVVVQGTDKKPLSSFIKRISNINKNK
ncbi:TIR domain-containing protein [Palleniella muris]|uniref:TIR domain-containing protein n=1 Tax=Palleniella muris TaxID=3038145 RepID=UPI001441C35A|nr:TIR domain-containing protein [Palleniella muris]